MCPLAEILHHEGYELSGSDMNEGETLDRIKGYGIPVFMGHAAENIKGAEPRKTGSKGTRYSVY